MPKTKKKGSSSNTKGPEYINSPLGDEMLNYREYYMSRTEKVLYAFLVFTVGGIVGLIFYGGLFKSDGDATKATVISNGVVFVLIGLIAAKIFLPALTKSLKEKRDKKLRTQFKDMLESLVASLSAGGTVNDAFRNAKRDLLNQYNDKDYIIVEITEILSGVGNGFTIEEMLIDFGNRSGNEDIQNFSNVIGNCYRMGGDFKDVVRKTRDVIADKMAIADEIETKIASNKLQHNAMCIMPIVLVGMLKVSNPSFASNLGSFLGVIVTTVAIGIFVASYFWGRKIIDIR